MSEPELPQGVDVGIKLDGDFPSAAPLIQGEYSFPTEGKIPPLEITSALHASNATWIK